MTREIPYMPLYVERFDVDTSHLSFEEDGAYNRLLRLCWRQSGCSLPDDRCWLIRNLRTDPDTFDRVVEPIIEEFFDRARGRLTQKRQREEFSKAVKLQRARRDAGLRGVAAKRLKNEGNGHSNGEAKVKQTATDPQAFREGKEREGKKERDARARTQNHGLKAVETPGRATPAGVDECGRIDVMATVMAEARRIEKRKAAAEALAAK